MSDRWTKEEEEYLDFIQDKEAKRRERLKKPTKKKLVRDLIPGIIAEEGGEVNLCEDHKIPFYFEKVREELAELEEAWKDHLMIDKESRHKKATQFAQVIEEAGDLKEATNALFKVLDMDTDYELASITNVADGVDSAMIKKRVAKGGFAKGFIMEFEIEEEG